MDWSYSLLFVARDDFTKLFNNTTESSIQRSSLIAILCTCISNGPWFFDKRYGECLLYYLKIWGDKFDFMAERKGGTMRIRPEKVNVTSHHQTRGSRHHRVENFIPLEGYKR